MEDENETAPVAMHVEEGEEPLEKKNFTLELMHEVKVAQSQNGLRHSDYQRYRQYCTRRLHRVRKAVDFVHDKKGYKAKFVTPRDVVNAKFLSIPLLNAERAWSYAMQLKNDINEDTSRKKFHMVKRLTKAVKWSTALQELCVTCADPKSQLESEAYAYWMHGNLLLEKDAHKEALAKFSHAKMVYEQLGQLGGMSLKALCQEKLSSLEAPLRYCNYVLSRKNKDSSSTEVDSLLKGMEMNEVLRSKLDAALGDSRHQEAAALESVDWQGNKVPLKNEKVRMYLVTATELNKQMEALLKEGTVESGVDDEPAEGKQDPSADLLLRIYTAYEDALSTIRGELREAERLKGKGTTGNLGVSEDTLITLKALRDYVMFLKLGVTKARHFRMATTLAQRLKDQKNQTADKKTQQEKQVKPDDLVHLCEKVSECINEMSELDTLKLYADVFAADLAFAKAFRCFFLAESYRRFKKFPQAYAVFQQALVRIREALALKQSPSNAEQLKALAAEAQGSLSIVQASVYLDQEEATDKLKNTSLEEKKSGRSEVLLDSLDEYRAFSTLAPFPPDFLATGCKPILFDLALNQIEFPDIKPRFPEKKAGWFGGLFGKK